MIAFPKDIKVPIVNYLTERRYEMVRASELVPGPEMLERIVAICNEPDVYDWLFRERLEGCPYTEEEARQWIEGSKSGWSSKTHFVFAILDESGAVAAACDIKSADPVSEIGYWASQRHRGLMTNGVRVLCALAATAGFQYLVARTKKENAQSQRVLKRAGFRRSPDQNDNCDWFARDLLHPRAPGVANTI
jgi:RimJ/RimL family protein N-acetyltransferase